MEPSVEFSQSTRLEKTSKKSGKPKGCCPPTPVSVSLISKKKKSGNAAEKISPKEPDCQDGDYIAFIKIAPAMELRRRFKAEATAHRNMLARRKSGRTVHPDFKDFRSFLLHVRPMPGKGMTLDRIDNNDPEYAPGKVRWADRYTQNNNKSDTLTFYCSRTGDVHTTSRLSKVQHVSAGAIRKRRQSGWTDDEIIAGKRSATLQKPDTDRINTVATAAAFRFPAGLYTPRQLALLSRSEAHFTAMADIQFHRDAHYHQRFREHHGENDMLPTYEELNELLEEYAGGITKENHKRHFLRWWKTNRDHVVYRDLKSHQRKMLSEYDPEWCEGQEEKEKAARAEKVAIQIEI